MVSQCQALEQLVYTAKQADAKDMLRSFLISFPSPPGLRACVWLPVCVMWGFSSVMLSLT